ncbi:DUF2975 family protein [Sinobacterium caligoides]|uniref:DUF2975 family protein n=1 Tax=Sinobacterium caligoides TaxID=933926 RepID=A0A3N2DNC7_9GAMM|nr:DUF2975 domain-containing protein [Sinobacterium caligoides]ROS01270.1 DUF2975 family protein [Sinobacterium caligoides]
MSNLQIQSRRVRRFFQFLLIATPCCVAYFWLTVRTQADIFSDSGLIQFSFDIANYTQLPLSMTTRMLALAVSLLMACIPFYALSVLIRLFRNYEENNIFSLQNTDYYRKLGYSLFFWVGGSLLYGALMSVILSFNNPPGERVLSISFVGLDVLTIILGLLVLIISWVMKEGQNIADENKQTI